jgi:hypothetical protein
MKFWGRAFFVIVPASLCLVKKSLVVVCCCHDKVWLGVLWILILTSAGGEINFRSAQLRNILGRHPLNVDNEIEQIVVRRRTRYVWPTMSHSDCDSVIPRIGVYFKIYKYHCRVTHIVAAQGANILLGFLSFYLCVCVC